MKTWLITGCSDGLGKGIAQAVLENGDRAVVTARDAEHVRHFEIEYPQQALALALDLSRAESIEEAVDAAQQFGPIDVLVNNAGHGYRAAIEESEPEAVRELFETNFFGPMHLIHALLPSMRQAHSGLIINVTSIGALRGALGNGYYSASKGAMELATEALGLEVRHLGIRTMCVEPGAMRTGFYGSRMGGTHHTIADYDPLAKRYRKEEIDGSAKQPDDPMRCGRIIYEIAKSGADVHHLLLGSDAVRVAENYYTNRLHEIGAWKTVSEEADFE